MSTRSEAFFNILDSYEDDTAEESRTTGHRTIADVRRANGSPACSTAVHERTRGGNKRGRRRRRRHRQNLLGLKDSVTPLDAVRAAADVPGLERRIEGLRREIASACKIIGCGHPDDLLPALRRQTDRLKHLERRLGLSEESRSRALR